MKQWVGGRSLQKESPRLDEQRAPPFCWQCLVWTKQNAAQNFAARKKKTKTKEKTEWGVGKAEDVAQLVQYLPNTHSAWWTCLQSDISRPGSRSPRANWNPVSKREVGRWREKGEGKEGSGIWVHIGTWPTLLAPMLLHRHTSVSLMG